MAYGGPRRSVVAMTPPNSHNSLSPTHFEAIAEFLDGAHVPYEMIEHDSVLSASAEARATHQSPDQVAKTIVLHDGGAYVIAAIPASQRLDLAKLRHSLGASRRLQLASEEQIARDFPELEVGAIPPFGPMVPAGEVIDPRLLDSDQVFCPAGDHCHSVQVAPRDVVRITAARVADICQD